MNQYGHRVSLIRGWLESWVDQHRRPKWYSWFGCYPKKQSVAAAKALLEAMDNNILVTQEEALEVFVK